MIHESGMDDIRSLLPVSKMDEDLARAIVAKGYPAVAPILSELFTWMQDMNWPVARILAPFLAGIGPPIVPEVRRILQGDDEIWQFWVLFEVVARAPVAVAEELAPELIRLGNMPVSEEGVADAARSILQGLGSLGNAP